MGGCKEWVKECGKCRKNYRCWRWKQHSGFVRKQKVPVFVQLVWKIITISLGLLATCFLYRTSKLGNHRVTALLYRSKDVLQSNSIMVNGVRIEKSSIFECVWDVTAVGKMIHSVWSDYGASTALKSYHACSKRVISQPCHVNFSVLTQ